MNKPSLNICLTRLSTLLITHVYSLSSFYIAYCWLSNDLDIAYHLIALLLSETLSISLFIPVKSWNLQLAGCFSSQSVVDSFWVISAQVLICGFWVYSPQICIMIIILKLDRSPLTIYLLHQMMICPGISGKSLQPNINPLSNSELHFQI